MAVFLSPVFGVAGQLFDDNGNPLAGGKIYTYTAGTTTPAATYTTSLGSIAHTNPIVLDGAGRVPSGEIWLTDGIVYKFVVEASNSVLIGTYDNLTGINSNFVAFTNDQEIQTATAGQTVFNLTTMQYQPGTNSLSVFVDGVNQYGPGAQYAYVETDSDTVTFVSGLHVGASVKFTTSQLNTSGAVDAEQVSYQPPFAGSVPTNVEAKLAQTVSVKDFGAVGDNVTDDTAAIQAAIDAAEVVYFPKGSYRINSIISKNQDRALTLIGDGYESQIITADIADSAFELPPGYGTGTGAMFWINVRNLRVEKLRFTSEAPVIIVETSGPGVFFRTDTDTTVYPQNITFDQCISEQASSDFLESGIYAGTGNNVVLNITGNQFINSGRYDVTVQNCDQLNVIGNFSKDSGAFFDVEPNGASDVALLVNIANNTIENAAYNCIQVSVAISGNRGACTIDGNVMSMSETYTATVAAMQPIAVRTNYVSITGNVLLKGKCTRLLDINACAFVNLANNTFNATVSNLATELMTVINSNVQSTNNYYAIPGVTNYESITGTSTLNKFDKNYNIVIGGKFEQEFALHGFGNTLDSRVFIKAGDMFIDCNGAAGEYTRFRARKSNAIALQYDANGILAAPSLPTSASGLVSGQLWVDATASNVVKRVP